MQYYISLSFALFFALQTSYQSFANTEDSSKKSVAAEVDLHRCSYALKSVAMDMHWYRSNYPVFHTGDDVWDHSAWSALAIEQFFDVSSPWVKNLDAKKDLLILTTFLHDVGKSGDKDLSTLILSGKREHPEIGFEYIVGQRMYSVLIPEILEEFSYVGNTFDAQFITAKAHSFEDINLAKLLLDSGCVKDQKTLVWVALGVGMHYKFGDILILGRENFSNPNQAYIDHIVSFIKQMHAESLIDLESPSEREQLVRFLIAVSAADVLGSQPVKLNKSSAFLLLNLFSIETLHDEIEVSNFVKFDYEGKLKWLEEAAAYAREKKVSFRKEDNVEELKDSDF
jgi:hypothetical protein